MQVLMATPSYYPIKGGEETVIRNLTLGLNRIGVKTDIMTFNMNRKWVPFWNAKTDQKGNYTVFKIPGLNWFPFEHSERITLGVNLIPGLFRNHIKEYDIIHFHSGDLAFPLFSLDVKKPRIFHFHSLYSNYYRQYSLNRVLLRNIATIYVAISRNMAQELKAIGIPDEKIRFLPNGVDTSFFTPNAIQEENSILFVGRLIFTKGVHVLLRSLRLLKKKVKLYIIGPNGNSKYFREIQDQIQKENKRGVHRITYVGEQESTEILKWYQKASIFVLPSFSEALSMSNLEAMACGVPVISTKVGGIPEAIHDGKNGILVAPNNHVKLADAIEYLLCNETIRKKYGLEGRRMVMKNYSNDIIIRKLHRIYKEIGAS